MASDGIRPTGFNFIVGLQLLEVLVPNPRTPFEALSPFFLAYDAVV